MYPTTPDGRYFVVKGQLCRCANPTLDEDVQERLVNDLMAPRREAKAEKPSAEHGPLSAVRAKVQKAKVALGERGPASGSSRASGAGA